MIRVETHVVADDSDYDMSVVAPPNDQYVSDDELVEPCTDSDSDSDQ